MTGYDKAHSTYNGYKVIRSSTGKDIDKILGLRNTIIYMPYDKFRSMSRPFREECIIRNIEVRILP